MGSIGTAIVQTVDISPWDSKIEKPRKSWWSTDREDLNWALEYMTREFGDFSDLVYGIKKRASNWGGVYDRYGLEGKGVRQVLFNSGYRITKELAVHELTHVIAVELADNAKKLGFKGEDDFYEKTRSEAYRNAGETEPKYDGRKWRDRAMEFFSRNIEYKAYRELKGQASDNLRDEALAVLKKYRREYRKGR